MGTWERQRLIRPVDAAAVPVRNNAVRPISLGDSTAEKILGMQKTIGNQAVQHMASTCPSFPSACPTGGTCHTCPAKVQAKLVIAQPRDKYEREADLVADTVMRMPQPGWKEDRPLQRSCLEREEELRRQPVEEEGELYTKQVCGGSAELTPNIQARIGGLTGSGQALPDSVRNFFESRFGHDLSAVRVHTGAAASEAAEAVNARAFTVGHKIIFGVNQYKPETADSSRLIAHELTHTIQQAGVAGKTLQREPARGTGLGRTKPKTGCDAPVCFSDPFEIFSFEFDSDQLRSGEDKRLRTLAKFLAPDESVSILGYASVEGPEDYNLNLACHRAIKTKEILRKETLGSIRSVHAVGETKAFGPELAENRAVQVFTHRPLPPPAPPTPTPEPKPKPGPKPSEPLNCGCAGTWNVTRAVPAPSLVGLVGCRCIWHCSPPPGIEPALPRPTFGCGGSPNRGRPGPGPRSTWGVKTSGGGEALESGDTCMCNRDDCMINVGITWKTIG